MNLKRIQKYLRSQFYLPLRNSSLLLIIISAGFVRKPICDIKSVCGRIKLIIERSKKKRSCRHETSKKECLSHVVYFALGIINKRTRGNVKVNIIFAACNAGIWTEKTENRLHHVNLVNRHVFSGFCWVNLQAKCNYNRLALISIACSLITCSNVCRFMGKKRLF